jgi:Ribbon-helix-helix protein, copG family
LRTTIRIDDALYRRVKSRAAQTGRTVSQVIGDAVRASLRPRSRHASELPPLLVVGGTGVLPGVDLADNAALRGHMDEETADDALR